MSEAVASDFTGQEPTGPEVAAEPAAEMPQAPVPGEGGAPEAGGTPDVPPQMDDPGDVDISGMMEGNQVATPPGCPRRPRAWLQLGSGQNTRRVGR